MYEFALLDVVVLHVTFVFALETIFVGHKFGESVNSKKSTLCDISGILAHGVLGAQMSVLILVLTLLSLAIVYKLRIYVPSYQRI